MFIIWPSLSFTAFLCCLRCLFLFLWGFFNGQFSPYSSSCSFQWVGPSKWCTSVVTDRYLCMSIELDRPLLFPASSGPVLASWQSSSSIGVSTPYCIVALCYPFSWLGATLGPWWIPDCCLGIVLPAQTVPLTPLAIMLLHANTEVMLSCGTIN